MTARPHATAHPRRRLRQAVALCVSAAALAGGAGAADASAATTLSYSEADRLEQSTGNLYWTSHDRNDHGADSATLWRASKSNLPGQEQALFTEYSQDHIFFGDLTYALTSDWYGYFVANYASSGISRIKRVPLTGGQAVTLATSPSFVALRDIANDGASLYWADASGLRRMPIGGGAVTTLVYGSEITSVGLNGSRVFYSQGASIRSVLKSGGAATLHVATPSAVTTMHVQVGWASTVVYWGEQNGSVKSHKINGTGVATYQGASSGRRTTSVSFDGTRVLWTDCAFPGDYPCAARKRQSSVTTTVLHGGSGMDNVQGDAGAMFFSDYDLRKHVH